MLNKEDLYPRTPPFPDGKTYPVTAGSHRVVVPENSYPISYGLPPLLATPKIFVARKNKPLDIYGFHIRRFISTRAKELLCEIDAAAFEFAQCETVTRRSLSVEPYWMMDIARIVHDFDEERSVFETAKGIDGSTGEPYDGPHLSQLYDIHMSPGLPDEHHAFVFSRHLRNMVFDEVLADAWRQRRFTGADFQPLQPPIPSERTEGAYAGNHMYWRKGKFRTQH